MTHARNIAVGRHGENVAARYLQELGITVLARNWVCPFGEIDIVARDGDTLVVCEVKTRTSDVHGSPLEAITGIKATRLRRLAQAWMDAHGLTPPSVRIDVISVVVPDRGPSHVDRVAGVA